MGGASAVSSDNSMPGAQCNSIKHMGSVRGGFDQDAALQKSNFLRRAQSVMTSGSDVSIKDPEAASEFVTLVSEAGPRAGRALIHMLSASMDKKEVMPRLPCATAQRKGRSMPAYVYAM